MNLKKLERFLQVNLLGPGPRLIKKKRIYRAAVSQRLRNTALHTAPMGVNIAGILIRTQTGQRQKYHK